jgi:hypothetical protein
MGMQKYNTIKYCIKCSTELTAKNWASYGKKRSAYICILCIKQQHHDYHKDNAEQQNKIQNNRRLYHKMSVLEYYGNKCANCGEATYETLTIDHIHNNGAAHRKEMTRDIFNLIYNEIVNKEDFQILCYNCNCTKTIEYKDRYHIINKNKVINAYGKKCAKCAISDIKYLTIDHKNNDGSKQRKELNCGTGSKLYRWLIKNNFPDLNLQVLCYNCNCSKEINLRRKQ